MVLGITTHLCLFFWKEINYSFMHFCHLLTNIPETGRRNGSFHLILMGKNSENYVNVLWIAFCSHRQMFSAPTHITDIQCSSSHFNYDLSYSCKSQELFIKYPNLLWERQKSTPEKEREKKGVSMLQREPTSIFLNEQKIWTFDQKKRDMDGKLTHEKMFNISVIM